MSAPIESVIATIEYDRSVGSNPKIAGHVVLLEAEWERIKEALKAYDSTADTLKHSQRVGDLLLDVVLELQDRSVSHDRSKTQPPELEVFNEFTPKLKHSTYGSDEYKGFLAAMGDGMAHHYAVNRHHPEHFKDGIDGMTLVDLAEMLADWKAATERHDDGDLARSLVIQAERFGIGDQLGQILSNTARHFGWLDTPTLYDPSSLALCAGCAHAGRFHQERVQCGTCGGTGLNPVDLFRGQPSGMDAYGHLSYSEDNDPCSECSEGWVGGCVADGCDCRKWEGT